MPAIVSTLSPRLMFGLLCGASLILWIRPLLHTLALAWNDDRHSHILLILPVASALILRDWKARSPDSQPGPRGAGSLLLLFSLVLAGLAKWAPPGVHSDTQLSVSMAGLVLWWIGAFAVSFGTTAVRAFLFPLLFLFWMVPIPTLVLDRVVVLLQHWSAIATQILFLIARVPVSREGIILFIPGVEIEVATECSSIRSSMMLIVTTMVLAQLLLRSPWRKAAVMLAAIPLSIAKNGIRIFTISMLGTRVDESYFDGWLHHHGGIIFLLAALLATFVVIWILRRGEERTQPVSAEIG